MLIIGNAKPISTMPGKPTMTGVIIANDDGHTKFMLTTQLEIATVSVETVKELTTVMRKPTQGEYRHSRGANKKVEDAHTADHERYLEDGKTRRNKNAKWCAEYEKGCPRSGYCRKPECRRAHLPETIWERLIKTREAAQCTLCGQDKKIGKIMDEASAQCSKCQTHLWLSLIHI